MAGQTRPNVKVIFSLTLIHFIGDFYISFVNPLLPVLMDAFALTLSQVGLIAGMMRMLAFVVQPVVGYFADRYRSRFFILGGPLLSIIFISLVGQTHFYLILFLFIALASIGSSMFHPSVAGMISNYAGNRFGFSMSLFNMGGTLAFGLGPLFITYVVSHFGLTATLWTAIPGLAIMVLLFRIVPPPLGEGLRGQGFSGAIRAAFGNVWKAVLLIWLVMVLRAFVSQAFLTFIPIHCSNKGLSLVAIGAVISLFSVVGSVSSILFGHLSDRIGYKPIYYGTFLLATPTLLFVVAAQGWWVYAGSALFGFLMFATQPLGLVMAQKLAPEGKSMVSSLMMGLAMGLGGMLIPIAGMVADFSSLQTVFYGVALIPFLSLGLVYFFPEERLSRISLDTVEKEP